MRRGVVLSNVNVIVSGYTNVGGRNQIVLARTLTGGSADPAFSGDGIVRLAPFPLGMAECYGIGVQSDGSIVTTGYGNVDVERGTTSNFLDMVSFRIRGDGTVDSSWAGAGGLALDVNAGEDRGRAALALPDDPPGPSRSTSHLRPIREPANACSVRQRAVPFRREAVGNPAPDTPVLQLFEITEF